VAKLLARNAVAGGVFGLITGFMEAGETPETGIARGAGRNRSAGQSRCACWAAGNFCA
jgi:hypothetical protein